MIDDPVQTWIELPPPPPHPSAGAQAAAAEVLDAMRGGADTVTLLGVPGSGRRTAALLAARDLGGDAYVVPALPWRAPGALRELARRVGVPTPVELKPQTIVAIARGALEGKSGTIVLDARVRAEPALLEVLRPPSGWRTIVLAPHDEAEGALGRSIELLLPGAPPVAAAFDQELLRAAAYFDPWEGAPVALLAAVAGQDERETASGISRLIEAGLLRPARDPRGVMPTLHAHQERAEHTDPGDPTNRALAERFVLAMATFCARAGADARAALADDRANLMTALSIWPDVAPVGLASGFAYALPMLLDDSGCHEAAKLVIQATRVGDEATAARGADARRRMGWPD